MPRIARQDKREDGTEVDSRNYLGQVRYASDVQRAPDGAMGLDVEPIEVVDGPVAMDMATALIFAEDELLVVIHQSGEKNQENPVPVGVNGRMCYVERGQKTLMKRKYVERLLRAQSDSVEQDVTAREERDFNRLTIRPTQRYPLSVLHDPHPNGSAWLQQITQGA